MFFSCLFWWVTILLNFNKSIYSADVEGKNALEIIGKLYFSAMIATQAKSIPLSSQMVGKTQYSLNK